MKWHYCNTFIPFASWACATELDDDIVARTHDWMGFCRRYEVVLNPKLEEWSKIGEYNGVGCVRLQEVSAVPD